MNILDNLENEIVSLLVKKRSRDTYKIPVNYYDNISKKELKQNINFNVFYLNKLIDKYIIIVKELQNIDIDIVNLVIKSSQHYQLTCLKVCTVWGIGSLSCSPISPNFPALPAAVNSLCTVIQLA